MSHLKKEGCRGGVVVITLKHLLGSTKGSYLCGVHLSAWVSSEYFGFLTCSLGSSGYTKLAIGLNVVVNSCLRMDCPGCIPPCPQSQFGLSPASQQPAVDKRLIDSLKNQIQLQINTNLSRQLNPVVKFFYSNGSDFFQDDPAPI